VVSERDEGALRCLKDIKWCGMEDSKGLLSSSSSLTSSFISKTVLKKMYTGKMLDSDAY